MFLIFFFTWKSLIKRATSLVLIHCPFPSPVFPSESRRSTLMRSCLKNRKVRKEKGGSKSGSNDSKTLSLKVLVPFHLDSHFLKVLLHLLAEAIVQTCEICKARNPKVEMKNVIFLSRKNFPQKRGLWLQPVQLRILYSTLSIRELAFPTELAPNRTVNDGSPSMARSMVSISALRGTNPGNLAKVCLVRS